MKKPRASETNRLGLAMERLALERCLQSPVWMQVPGATSIRTRFQRQDVFGCADFVICMKDDDPNLRRWFAIQVCDTSTIAAHRAKMKAFAPYILDSITLELIAYKLPKLAPNSMHEKAGFDGKDRWHGPRFKEGKLRPEYAARIKWRPREVVL